jgi:hypothetical protein
MKLLRMNSTEFRRFFTNGDLTRAYLGSNVIAISEQLTSTALLIRERS